MASFPIPTFQYLWAIYIFPWSVCLFCCRKIGGPIVGIYKSLTDTWIWKLGTRPHSFISGNISIGSCLQCSTEYTPVSTSPHTLQLPLAEKTQSQIVIIWGNVLGRLYSLNPPWGGGASFPCLSSAKNTYCNAHVTKDVISWLILTFQSSRDSPFKIIKF